jgi:hypothetical protein
VWVDVCFNLQGVSHETSERILGRKTVDYMMLNHLGDERIDDNAGFGTASNALESGGSTLQQYNAAGFLGTNRAGQGYSLLGSVVTSPAQV